MTDDLNAKRDARIKAKESIASLRLTGLSLRKVTGQLKDQGITQHNGKPWAKSTVHEIMQELRDEWRDAYLEDSQILLGEQYAKLLYVEEQVMQTAKGEDGNPIPINVQDFIAIHDRKMRLLGLEKPIRLEITGAQGGAIKVSPHMSESEAVEVIEKMGLPYNIKTIDAQSEPS